MVLTFDDAQGFVVIKRHKLHACRDAAAAIAAVVRGCSGVALAAIRAGAAE